MGNLLIKYFYQSSTITETLSHNIKIKGQLLNYDIFYLQSANLM